MKILTVCLGNICRSPMAEGILRKKIKDRQLDYTVDSAGTAAYHVDSPPDKRAQETLSKKGINISSLRGRQFETDDFNAFDLILTMDEENYQNILSLATTGEEKGKIKMLMNYLYPGKNISVPDPYFGGPQGFEKVYEMIDQATDRLLDSLTQMNK